MSKIFEEEKDMQKQFDEKYVLPTMIRVLLWALLVALLVLAIAFIVCLILIIVLLSNYLGVAEVLAFAAQAESLAVTVPLLI